MKQNTAIWWRCSKLLKISLCLTTFFSCILSATAGDVIVEPYAGLGYALSYKHMSSDHRGINYQDITNPLNNSIAATFGLRFTPNWAAELTATYSMAATANKLEGTTTANTVGIKGSSDNLSTLRINGVFSFSDQKASDNNFVVLFGLLLAHDSVTFDPSGKLKATLAKDNPTHNNAVLPSDQQLIDANLAHSRIGLMLELGFGYVVHFGERIDLRIEARFSPIHLSGTSRFLASGMVGLYFNF